MNSIPLENALDILKRHIDLDAGVLSVIPLTPVVESIKSSIMSRSLFKAELVTAWSQSLASDPTIRAIGIKKMKDLLELTSLEAQTI